MQWLAGATGLGAIGSDWKRVQSRVVGLVWYGTREPEDQTSKVRWFFFSQRYTIGTVYL